MSSGAHGQSKPCTDDAASARRDRNKESAKKSRAKKKKELAENQRQHQLLEASTAQLLEERTHLRQMVAAPIA